MYLGLFIRCIVSYVRIFLNFIALWMRIRGNKVIGISKLMTMFHYISSLFHASCRATRMSLRWNNSNILCFLCSSSCIYSTSHHTIIRCEMLIKSINDLLFGLNGYIAIHVFIYIDKKKKKKMLIPNQQLLVIYLYKGWENFNTPHKNST